MDPVSDNLVANRASLRAKYEKAVSDLIKALRSDPKPTYPSNELVKLRVTLGSFDPEDQNFLASNICLFKPMSSEQILEYSLDLSKQSSGTRDLCNNYDNVHQPPAGTTGRRPDRKVEVTYRYLNRHYESSYKETKRYPKSLAGTSKWHHIREGNPFSDLPWGLLSGYPLTNESPFWDVRDHYEWQDDYRDPETICPHMMLVMFTGAVAVEGELLFCELGCIAQVIHNRLQQEEFEKTSLFPV
jgi:hypothetical protein